MSHNLPVSVAELEAFIVRAKAQTYAGDGKPSLSYRPGSHDLQFHLRDFAYMDSYFGGTDFIGQEVVYYAGKPVWAMNYYGRILDNAAITGAETGRIIRASLTAMYAEGRFLGGFEYRVDDDVYMDTSEGNVTSFTGKEWILRNQQRVYELVYHGGLIKA